VYDMPYRRLNMIGQHFGRWLVIDRSERPEGYRHRGSWMLCRCDCGIVRPVKSNSLRMGRSQSCGCAGKEHAPKGDKHHAFIHGHTMNGKRSKEWIAWNAMIRRCRYPSMQDYPCYGGRGISVCRRWATSFEKFLEDVGYAPGPEYSLDRINNNGNYKPGNTHWATAQEQMRNSRTVRLITYDRRTMTIGDWAEETGLNRQTIQMRLDEYGWSIQDSLTKPPRRGIKPR